VDNPEKFDFSVFGIGMIGGAFGLVIAKGYISDLRAKQTEDSILQFEQKKNKLKK